jgi:hypothetical protein
MQDFTAKEKEAAMASVVELFAPLNAGEATAENIGKIEEKMLELTAEMFKYKEILTRGHKIFVKVQDNPKVKKAIDVIDRLLFLDWNANEMKERTVDQVFSDNTLEDYAEEEDDHAANYGGLPKFIVDVFRECEKDDAEDEKWWEAKIDEEIKKGLSGEEARKIADDAVMARRAARDAARGY